MQPGGLQGAPMGGIEVGYYTGNKCTGGGWGRDGGEGKVK